MISSSVMAVPSFLEVAVVSWLRDHRLIAAQAARIGMPCADTAFPAAPLVATFGTYPCGVWLALSHRTHPRRSSALG